MYVVVVTQEAPVQGALSGGLLFSAQVIGSEPLMVNTYKGPFIRKSKAEDYAASVAPGEFPSATATVQPLVWPYSKSK